MQDGGDNTGRIHTHARQDAGNFKWMVNIGLATTAHLAFVGLGTKQVGAVNVGDLILIQIDFQQIAQVTDQ